MPTRSWWAPGWPGWWRRASCSTPAPGDPGRSGARAESRRSGLLVLRRVVLRRLARAAADADQGLRRARLAGLAGHGRLRPPRRRGHLAAPVGRGLRPLRGRREARRGCTSAACAGSRSSAGPSAAATPPPVTATRCRASTSPGAPARASSRRSPRARRRRRPRPVALRLPASGGRADATDGAVDGVRGTVLEPSDVARSAPSSRTAVGEFELHAPAVIVTSGGIGGNFDLVRANWPARMGDAAEER